MIHLTVISRRTISTHALTEGDGIFDEYIDKYKNFNSRPHGGRRGMGTDELTQSISTHALTEGDNTD